MEPSSTELQNLPKTELRMPKVFDWNERRTLAGREEELMTLANQDHHEIVQKTITLFGKEFYVFPYVNLQGRITLACDRDCGFCIERFTNDRFPESADDLYVGRMEDVFHAFHEQGMFPSMTITGGEPTVRLNRLKKVIKTLHDLGVTKFNVNSNARITPELGAFFVENTMPNLNISLHHWDREQNGKIMGGKNPLGMEDIKEILNNVGGGGKTTMPRVRLQCVLLDGYVDTVAKMEEYMERARDIGADNFDFRGLSTLSTGIYQSKGVAIPEMLDYLADHHSDKWKPVCQSVTDWYIYEDWYYDGMNVRINHSNMDLSRKFETQEKLSGKSYGREFVIFEDGAFGGSWNRDLGLVLEGYRPRAKNTTHQGNI